MAQLGALGLVPQEACGSPCSLAASFLLGRPFLSLSQHLAPPPLGAFQSKQSPGWRKRGLQARDIPSLLCHVAQSPLEKQVIMCPSTPTPTCTGRNLTCVLCLRAERRRLSLFVTRPPQLLHHFPSLHTSSQPPGALQLALDRPFIN